MFLSECPHKKVTVKCEIDKEPSLFAVELEDVRLLGWSLLLWQSIVWGLAIGSRQVSHYLCRYSTISWGAEELSWGLISLRFRCLIGCAFFGKERNTEGLGCGMVFLFLFLHYLTMEPRAGSSAFLSPNNFLSMLFLVDTGGREARRRL